MASVDPHSSEASAIWSTPIRTPKIKGFMRSICSRTRALSEADEDPEIYPWAVFLSSGALIYGEVKRYRSDDEPGPKQTPMAGVKINIDGEKNRSKQ